jgi:hypothetical protein
MKDFFLIYSVYQSKFKSPQILAFHFDYFSNFTYFFWAFIFIIFFTHLIKTL